MKTNYLFKEFGKNFYKELVLRTTCGVEPKKTDDSYFIRLLFYPG